MTLETIFARQRQGDRKRMSFQDTRPTSPYHPEVPRPPSPSAYTVEKWIFFSNDSHGKSAVICIHPRFFVTFRHGSHLGLKPGDPVQIYNGTQEMDKQVAIDVFVAQINERLDFILLKSETNVVESYSPLAKSVENAEPFILAGFGNNFYTDESGNPQQKLSYLDGIIYSTHKYYYNINDKSMGPFILGTGKSSAGDSGAGCWGAKGLIGINVAATKMSPTDHNSAIAEAAIYSPKNIISTSDYFLEALMHELCEEEIKEKKENKASSSKNPHFPVVDFNLGWS